MNMANTHCSENIRSLVVTSCMLLESLLPFHHYKATVYIVVRSIDLLVQGGGGSEQWKVTPQNSGQLQKFIAYFWRHNWIV